MIRTAYIGPYGAVPRGLKAWLARRLRMWACSMDGGWSLTVHGVEQEARREIMGWASCVIAGQMSIIDGARRELARIVAEHRRPDAGGDSVAGGSNPR